MWIYRISTGALSIAEPDGETMIASGYSGFGDAKNDPGSVDKAGLGPIPMGAYAIGELEDSEVIGSRIMRLTPLAGTQECGRSGFEIHGDSREHPGRASHGCICIDRDARETIGTSGDKLLIVLTGLESA